MINALAHTMRRNWWIWFNRAGLPAQLYLVGPFAGSGTTGAVAIELGRKAILIELNPRYVELIERRCNVTPGLALA